MEKKYKLKEPDIDTTTVISKPYGIPIGIIIIPIVVMFLMFMEGCNPKYVVGFYIPTNQDSCEYDFFNLDIPSKYHLEDTCGLFEYSDEQYKERYLIKIGSEKEF